MRNPTFGFSVHGAPERAYAFRDTRSVTIELVEDFGSRITLFVGDAALAERLAQAINGALTEHRAQSEALAISDREVA